MHLLRLFVRTWPCKWLLAAWLAACISCISCISVAQTQSESALPSGGRSAHTTTLLANGKLLVVGGVNNEGSLLGADLYDPASNTWTAAGRMITRRAHHLAIALPDGKVLVVGGDSADWNNLNMPMNAEIYDPSSNSWRGAGSLNRLRMGYTAVLRADGKVMLVGGAVLKPDSKVVLVGGADPRQTEVYDPASNSWSEDGILSFLGFGIEATPLADGRILAVGESAGRFCLLKHGCALSQLYDAKQNRWLATPSLPHLRRYHSATLLANGQVLVAGGGKYGSSPWLRAERYDPAQGRWQQTGPMLSPRSNHTATRLADGQVLVVGGMGNRGPLASAEIYDPVSNRWHAAGRMARMRVSHTATLLANGSVVVLGGYSDDVEVYDPLQNQWRKLGRLPVNVTTQSDAAKKTGCHG